MNSAAVPESQNLAENTRHWPKEVLSETLESELHDYLESNFDALGLDAALVGREVELEFEKKPDLICVARDGTLGVIELKRDRAQREVLAQVMEYACLVKTTSRAELDARIVGSTGSSIVEVHRQRFQKAMEASSDLFIIIVARGFSEEFKKIVTFLNQNHCFSISLVSFCRKGSKGSEKDFNFSPVLDAGDCIEIMPPDLPPDVYAIRFEENGITWNDCITRQTLPVSATGAALLEPSIARGCAKIAVDLAYSGYVGLGTIRKLRRDSGAPGTHIIEVEWDKTLDGQRAIYRCEMFRPSENVQVMADVETWRYLELEFSRREKTKNRKRAAKKRGRRRRTSSGHITRKAVDDSAAPP